MLRSRRPRVRHSTGTATTPTWCWPVTSCTARPSRSGCGRSCTVRGAQCSRTRRRPRAGASASGPDEERGRLPEAGGRRLGRADETGGPRAASARDGLPAPGQLALCQLDAGRPGRGRASQRCRTARPAAGFPRHCGGGYRWAAADGYSQPYGRAIAVSAAVARRVLRNPTMASGGSPPVPPGFTPPFTSVWCAGFGPHGWVRWRSGRSGPAQWPSRSASTPTGFPRE